MKLIDYDKHRTEIQKKVMEFIVDPKLTFRETIDKIMKLLDNLPADYTEEQVTEIDQAYQRVCRELEEAQREAEERGTAVYVAIHRIITERIDQIQALLSQYPDSRDENLHGRLDELYMTQAECKKTGMKWALTREECEEMEAEIICRMFRENMQAEQKFCGKEKPLKQ